MRYLVFTIIFMVVTYLAATMLMKLTKVRKLKNIEPLSKNTTDVCKGIAILIIMLSHIGNEFGVRYLTPLGSLGVGIFLCLSAYGLEISTHKSGLKGYWIKRILTAWLPYALTEIIGVILCVTPEYANLRIYDMALDLLLIRTIHPFGWYMQCLFLYYIAFYLSHRIFNGNKIWKYAVLSIAAIGMFVFFRSLFKQQLFAFIAGVIIADHTKLREKINSPLNGVIAFVFGVVCLILRQTHYVRQLKWIYESLFAFQVVLIAMGVIILVGWLCANTKTVFYEVALSLGVISYEVYLYHGWVYQWISTFSMSYARIIIFFLLSILISIPVYIGKSKLIAILKGKLLS